MSSDVMLDALVVFIETFPAAGAEVSEVLAGCSA